MRTFGSGSRRSFQTSSAVSVRGASGFACSHSRRACSRTRGSGSDRAALQQDVSAVESGQRRQCVQRVYPCPAASCRSGPMPPVGSWIGLACGRRWYKSRLAVSRCQPFGWSSSLTSSSTVAVAQSRRFAALVSIGNDPPDPSLVDARPTGQRSSRLAGQGKRRPRSARDTCRGHTGSRPARWRTEPGGTRRPSTPGTLGPRRPARRAAMSRSASASPGRPGCSPPRRRRCRPDTPAGNASPR